MRRAELEWRDRTNVDGWDSTSAVYWRDDDNGLVLRLVEWPAGATEPVHTHPGTHATTVITGRVIVDGIELGPLGVILGNGGEPHGPLRFPEGAYLVSALQDDPGQHLHIRVTDPSVEPQRSAVPTGEAAWVAAGGGTHEEKTLIDGVLGRLRVSALRFAPGGLVGGHAHEAMQAAVVVEGSADLDGERLDVWDLMYAAPGATHGPVAFPDGALLLVWTLAPAAGP